MPTKNIKLLWNPILLLSFVVFVWYATIQTKPEVADNLFTPQDMALPAPQIQPRVEQPAMIIPMHPVSVSQDTRLPSTSNIDGNLLILPATIGSADADEVRGNTQSPRTRNEDEDEGEED